MFLKSLLVPTIDYNKIESLIVPWIQTIYNKKEFKHFNRAFSLFLLKTNTIDLKDKHKVTLFLFFTLLPLFYNPTNNSELLFINLLKSYEKLDFENTIKDCFVLFYNTICPLHQVPLIE
jgi:hypothetical protein